VRGIRVERELRFGFLPEPSSYSGGGLLAEPLPDFGERVSSVWSSGLVDGSWLHPPLIKKNGSRGFGPVPVASEVYTVPETHVLRPAGDGHLPENSLCDLIISVIGFLKGLRLIPEGWNHFYRTPVQIGSLVDFYCDDSQIGKAVEQTLGFASLHSGTEMPTRMFAALHWHLTSQSYEHEFEIFNAQYVVLDTCWAIFREKIGSIPQKPPHAERLLHMCNHFGIPIPKWALVSNKISFLSNLRNEMLHGGYFAQAPIGFEHPAEYPDIDLELRDLNSRLILALLGLSSPYIQSQVGRGCGFRVVFQ
jgi:hypothetical protein